MNIKPFQLRNLARLTVEYQDVTNDEDKLIILDNVITQIQGILFDNDIDWTMFDSLDGIEVEEEG